MHTTNYWLSLGGAGNSLLKTAVETSDIVQSPSHTMFVNFSRSDVAESIKGQVAIFGGEGTGRDRDVGLKMLDKYRAPITKQVNEFFDRIAKASHYRRLVIVASMGGGTGSALLPFVIELAKARFAQTPEVQICVGVIMSSASEGVATLVNGVKAFQDLYNVHAINQDVGAMILFDNQKMEAVSKNAYDFRRINEFIVSYFEDLFDEKALHESSDGFQTLDMLEYRRVLGFGRGLCDLSINRVEEFDLDRFDVRSSLFHGVYKYSDAKAASVLVRFQKPSKKVSQENLDQASSVVALLKKRFEKAFFLHGYNFNNPDMPGECEIRIVINGLPIPSFVMDNAKRAHKSVSNIKKKNEEFNAGDVNALSF